MQVFAQKNSTICFLSWYFHYLSFKTVHILILIVNTANQKQLFGTSARRDFEETASKFHQEENTSVKHNFSQKFYPLSWYLFWHGNEFLRWRIHYWTIWTLLSHKPNCLNQQVLYWSVLQTPVLSNPVNLLREITRSS